MLSPVSCPSESLNVGVVWGILSTQSSLGKAPAAANARAGAGTFSSRILVMCFMCFFYCYYKAWASVNSNGGFCYLMSRKILPNNSEPNGEGSPSKTDPHRLTAIIVKLWHTQRLEN